MENCARKFDQPIESPEHQDLRTSAWMGGAGISTRYWLGRLLRHNFYRESDDIVKDALQKYLATNGCEKCSRLVSDYECWGPIATVLLQHQVESIEGCQPTQNPRLVAAL